MGAERRAGSPHGVVGVVGVVLGVLLLGGGCRDRQAGAGELPARPAAPPAAQPSDPRGRAPTIPPEGRTVLVAAAGDIAGRFNRHHETATLLLAVNRRTPLDAVLVLGDLQYPRGELHDFLAYYHRSWGQAPLRTLTRPVPGNHEYDQGRSAADGYFDYFNGPGQHSGMAGERDKGYYSFDLGAWHFVAINTSDGCRKIPCGVGSAMLRWLVADLAATKQRCVLAYWHHPRYQVGAYHRSNRAVAPLWNALVDAGAELVLSGHEHNFQQLARLGKEGRPDPGGLRSFVIGTGGASPYPAFDESNHPSAAETRFARRAGFLLLTLAPDEFKWQFLATNGTESGEVLAEGRDVCR